MTYTSGAGSCPVIREAVLAFPDTDDFLHSSGHPFTNTSVDFLPTRKTKMNYNSSTDTESRVEITLYPTVIERM